MSKDAIAAQGPLDRGVGRLALEGKYGEVLGPFVALMETELHANAAKGDRLGWLAMSPDTALLEIYWHTAKLSAAVKNGDMALITEHSADVANMAMMLLDVCGGLMSLDDAGDYTPMWKETPADDAKISVSNTGFKFGALTVDRVCTLPKGGASVRLETPHMALNVLVTKTGKLRITTDSGIEVLTGK